MTEPIKTVGRSVVCTFPNGDRFLLGEITIDCPICGEGEFRIAGHHMRSVLRLLAQWVEEHPDLTGPEEVVSMTNEAWQGSPPGDPTAN
jgi:hypothetical protein